MILQYLFLADDPPLIKYKTQLFRNVDVMFFLISFIYNPLSKGNVQLFHVLWFVWTKFSLLFNIWMFKRRWQSTCVNKYRVFNSFGVYWFLCIILYLIPLLVFFSYSIIYLKKKDFFFSKNVRFLNLFHKVMMI